MKMPPFTCEMNVYRVSSSKSMDSSSLKSMGVPVGLEPVPSIFRVRKPSEWKCLWSSKFLTHIRYWLSFHGISLRLHSDNMPHICNLFTLALVFLRSLDEILRLSFKYQIEKLFFRSPFVLLGITHFLGAQNDLKFSIARRLEFMLHRNSW